jgi:hypothetical protein
MRARLTLAIGAMSGSAACLPEAIGHLSHTLGVSFAPEPIGPVRLLWFGPSRLCALPSVSAFCGELSGAVA